MNEPVYVTRTFLPPKEEYLQYIDAIWDSAYLTNQGQLLKKFEKETSAYLGIGSRNFQFVANGTLALQIALQALDITGGEVITTPFSYVATTSAILWQRCTPVFVDIDPDTLCIDADKIEAAITPQTKAIMPVHVFGNPCDVAAIDAIARKHNLKVIYDAAHALGVEYKDKSLLDYGDIAVCSFHATKLFHTIEGGCLVIRDKEVSDKVELIKRFGHNNDEHYMLGINAKATEFQAAMGLCNLKYVGDVIRARKKASNTYDRLLADKFKRQTIRKGTTYNYGYYPVLFNTEAELTKTVDRLRADNIFPRRYFYPSLNTLPYLAVHQACPVSEDISRRILCLPLYAGLEGAVINKICEVLLT